MLNSKRSSKGTSDLHDDQSRKGDDQSRKECLQIVFSNCNLLLMFLKPNDKSFESYQRGMFSSWLYFKRFNLLSFASI